MNFSKNVRMMVVCSKQWEKEGKRFNTITFSILGLGACSFTVDERLVPNLVDGQLVKVDLDLGISNNKPYIKPNWESMELLNVGNID